MSFICCNVRRKINHPKLATIRLLPCGKKEEIKHAECWEWALMDSKTSEAKISSGEGGPMKGNLWFLFAKRKKKKDINGAYSKTPFIAIWHQRSRRERPPKSVPDKQTMFATSFFSESRESFWTSQNSTLHQDLGAHFTCWSMKSWLPQCWELQWNPAQHLNKDTVEKTIGERPCTGEHGDRCFASKFKNWLKPPLLLTKTKK